MNSARALEILTALAASFSAPSAHVPKLDNDPVQQLPGGYSVAELAQACRVGANIIRELQSGDSCDSAQVLSQFEKGW